MMNQVMIILKIQMKVLIYLQIHIALFLVHHMIIMIQRQVHLIIHTDSKNLINYNINANNYFMILFLIFNLYY